MPFSDIFSVCIRRVQRTSSHPTSFPFLGLPSGYVKIAIENDHRNSGFSH